MEAETLCGNASHPDEKRYKTNVKAWGCGCDTLDQLIDLLAETTKGQYA